MSLDAAGVCAHTDIAARIVNDTAQNTERIRINIPLRQYFSALHNGMQMK
jgi:hypothetical protein